MSDTKESSQHIQRFKKIALALLVVLMVVVPLVGCQPRESTEQTDDADSNAVIGEYESVTGDPFTLSEGNSSMTTGEEATEEEATQQDRVSGGANSGGVSSENIEPLVNMTEPIELPEEFTIALNGSPSPVLHEISGRGDCLSCHGEGKSEQQVPQSHIKANIGSDLCTQCHQEQ